MVGRLIRNIQEHDRIVGGINKESTHEQLNFTVLSLQKER